MQNTRKNHIAAGSYYVGCKEDLLLYAFLGSCLGIAVYDAAHHVGGLCHFLLPEPISDGSVDFPEKYASTGFPLFLEELCRKGAKREQMQVYIAGGALVTPLSPYDLSLDIGGRTFEKVYSQLRNENIKIAKVETGGFFTCCLSINLKNGECVIEPVEDTMYRSEKIPILPKHEEINRTIVSLKPIPQVALKLLRMIAGGVDDIKAISDEVKTDQVISAKTLMVCNSAHFARPLKFESIDHAIVYMGREQFVKLILTAFVNDYFNQSDVGYSLCKGGLFHHAVGTALISEQLSILTRMELPSVAYTAGLLHDIGKVVLDQYIHSAFPLFYRSLKDDSSHILQIEKRLFGITHTEIGKILSEKWNLAACHREVIEFHHAPSLNKPQQNLSRIVYVADILMTRFCAGLEFEKVATENLKVHLDLLGLSLDSFPMLVDRIPKETIHHFMS